MRFDENPFTCRCKTENQKAEGFQISQFCGSFSSDFMAGKGVTVIQCAALLLTCHENHTIFSTTVNDVFRPKPRQYRKWIGTQGSLISAPNTLPIVTLTWHACRRLSQSLGNILNDWKCLSQSLGNILNDWRCLSQSLGDILNDWKCLSQSLGNTLNDSRCLSQSLGSTLNYSRCLLQSLGDILNDSRCLSQSLGNILND